MYTRDCQINTYYAICKKYPHIKVDKKEDLNIENNIVKILEKCWYDKERYGHVGDIALVTGLSERQVFRFARKYNFAKRIF
jgi:hypothetical protein